MARYGLTDLDGGGSTRTTQRITLGGEIVSVLLFPFLEMLVRAIELGVYVVVALAIGSWAGPLMLALALVLAIDVELDRQRDGSLIVLYGWRDLPPHYAKMRLMLAGVGALALAALVANYWPQWIRWWWIDGQLWYSPRMTAFVPVTPTIIFARLLVVFGLPYVALVPARVAEWAVRQEAVNPKFRELTWSEASPAGQQGPTGEEYIPARRGRATVILDEEPEEEERSSAPTIPDSVRAGATADSDGRR